MEAVAAVFRRHGENRLSFAGAENADAAFAHCPEAETGFETELELALDSASSASRRD